MNKIALALIVGLMMADTASAASPKFGPDDRCELPADDPTFPKSDIPLEPGEVAISLCNSLTPDQLKRAKVLPQPTKTELEQNQRQYKEYQKQMKHLDAPGVELTDDLLVCTSQDALTAAIVTAKPGRLPVEFAVRDCTLLPVGKKVEAIGHGQTALTLQLHTEDGKKVWTFAYWLKLATE